MAKMGGNQRARVISKMDRWVGQAVLAVFYDGRPKSEIYIEDVLDKKDNVGYILRDHNIQIPISRVKFDGHYGRSFMVQFEKGSDIEKKLREITNLE